MESKFIPKMDALKSINWRKPEFDKSDKKKIILLLLGLALLVVVFIPWYSIGIESEDVGFIKLRAFGFHTWYGIVAAIVALISIAGVLYKQFAVTFLSSVAALAIGLYAINDYPTMRVSASVNEDLEPAAEIIKQMQDLEYPEYPEYDQYRDYDELYEAREYYYHEVESYERKYHKLARQLEEYPDACEFRPFISLVNELEELPTLKIPGEFIEAAMVFYDLYDQDFVEELLDKTGLNKKIKKAEKRIKKVCGDYDIIYHRWGAILYLVFAVLAAIMSYIVITGCCCKKQECAVVEPEAPAASSDETKLA
jgi:hypothetical protein